MSRTQKRKREFINTSPHMYEARDILHHTLQQSINGSSIYSSNSTYFVARVLKVRKSTDPEKEEEYTVIARMVDLDNTVPEPEVYTIIKQENINGLNEYIPLNKELPIPSPGQYIMVGFTDLKTRNGPIYLGTKKDFDLEQIKGNKKQNFQQTAGPLKKIER